MKIYKTIGLAIFMSSIAWGQNLQLGTPVLNGSGCAPGTTSVTLSADQTVLSVLYSNFHVDTDEQGLSIANCNMTIPIKVPDGYSLKVFKVDYRGFVSLPQRGVTAELSTNHTFMNRHTRRGVHASTKKFKGPLEEDFTETQAIRNIWNSDCGAQTEIQLDTQLIIRNLGQGHRPRDGRAEISLDSLDGGTGMEYDLELRRCR